VPSLLAGRSPPEHRTQFEWIVGTVIWVNEFIADMIAEAIERKAGLRPLAPHPFRQILACNHRDPPEHPVPHAMFIQHTLYDFAALLPARGSTGTYCPLASFGRQRLGDLIGCR
jgi:hypothetical protein